MATKFSGRVLFANGLAVPNVQVRVFDKDAPGKVDDDLTEIPGLSDEQGHFTVRYNIGKFLDVNTLDQINLLNFDVDWPSWSRNIRLPDPTDIYLPYLQFSYQHAGKAHTHTSPLGLFQHEFRLPQSIPLDFKPSVHGFKFLNNFPGYPLPFSVPALPGAGDVTPAYGLCGGMSSAACDFLLAGRKIPQTEKAPRAGTRLHRYLYRRAIDTFGSFGESLLKVAGWMRLPEEGTHGSQKRTLDEFADIRARLDDYQAVVVALVYTGADTLSEIMKQIWNNHQVLAYAWSQVSQDSIDLHIYDSNYPLHDEVVIRGEQCQVGELELPDTGKTPVYGLRCEQWVGDKMVRRVRGFFPMPYVPVEPPSYLV